MLLALAAILSNHVSELAIAEWGASQSEEVKQALGFQRGVTPRQSTIHRHAVSIVDHQTGIVLTKSGMWSKPILSQSRSRPRLTPS